MITKQWLRLGVALLPLYAAQVWAAQNPDTGPGCGLGKLAWGEYQNQKDIAPQVLQSTTNGTFGSQTFGITFGTSNCVDGSGGVASTRSFVETNREVLAKDISRGSGETIATLATIAGCADVAAVGTKLQASFHSIFPFPGVSDTDVSYMVVRTLERDTSLACTKLL